MHKFIKTFYLWLGLFTFCNLVTLVSAFRMAELQAEKLLLYPVAWILQIPLIFVISLAHCGLNRLLSFLPKSGEKVAGLALCIMIIIVFLGTYAASQIMYIEINSFISWDALRVALDNTLQILPDIGRSNTAELVLIGIIAITTGIAYTHRYHNHAKTHSQKLFMLFCVVFLTSGAGGFALVYNSPDTSSDRIRKELLPTTYLTLSIIDSMLPTAMPSSRALTDLVLEPQIILEDFLPADSMTSKPNVFFIMLEAISWDHFGFSGYPRKDVTPNLDALAAESVVFTRSYATANHSNYSQTSIHSSQYPLRRKQLDCFENVDYPKTLLFDILSHAGYQTAFFSAQNEDWQGMKRFIHANTELQHFYHSKDELGSNTGIESKIDDQLVRVRATEYLRQRDACRPMFMYMNLQATHFPYDIPNDASHPYHPCSTADFEFKFFHYDKSHLEQVVNKYDNALHYVDVQIGAFIAELKQLGLYDNSLIIIAPDHGEAFYQRGYPTHGTSLFEDQMRTATIFKLPSSHRGNLRTDAISLIDINPTILEILGQPNHPNFQGQQVLKKPRNGYIYLLSHGVIKSHGILEYPWKYIISQREGELLFNLERDPLETNDVSKLSPERFEQLKQELAAYHQRQMYYYSVLSEKDRSESYPPHH
jgi:arylsulfatase